MNNILLVDKDLELTFFLTKLLKMEGFNVLVARNSTEALDLINNNIDLLLLDIILSKESGIDILKKLRQRHKKIPIIILTSQESELDCILGLESGADDYLPKPFNDRELIARIRAILRRSNWREQENKGYSSVLKIDLLSLYPSRQEACFNGKILELTGTEFTLLYILAQHIGRVVSRENLSQNVLGKRLTQYDRAIDMHISNLRRKLPKRKDGYPWFKTIRGKGYLMISSL